MQYNNTLHPRDPYTGEQLSFIRYSGYREHQFHMGRQEREEAISAVKFIGCLACAAVGFVVLCLFA